MINLLSATSRGSSTKRPEMVGAVRSTIARALIAVAVDSGELESWPTQCPADTLSASRSQRAVS